MTQEFLLDALTEDLAALFRHHRLKSSAGAERTVRVYPQGLPFREGPDEETEEEPPEPYILVRLPSGELPDPGALQTLEVLLVICVQDPAPDRQGYRDALHIVNQILLHYGENGVVGGRWVLQYPMKWATQEEDTHPYYFAAISLAFEGPAIYKEVPET